MQSCEMGDRGLDGDLQASLSPEGGQEDVEGDRIMPSGRGVWGTRTGQAVGGSGVTQK